MKIEPESLDVYAFRVQPMVGLHRAMGSIRETVQDFLSKSGSTCTLSTFFALGNVDLLFLVEGNMRGQLLPVVEGSRFLHSLRCFSLPRPQTQKGEGGDAPPPFGVLQCCQLRAELADTRRCTAISEIAHPKVSDLQDEFPGKITARTYGTLGWTELLSTVFTSSVSSLFEYLTRSRSLLHDGSSVFSTTFSLPIVRIRIQDSSVVPDGTISDDLIDAHIALSCEPGTEGGVLTLIEPLFSGFEFTVCQIFGKVDYSVNVTQIPLNILIDNLLKLQSKGDCGLAGVETSIERPARPDASPTTS